MYNLKDFVSYDGTCNKTQNVLVWHKKDGYYFTQFQNCSDDVKIIAKEA